MYIVILVNKNPVHCNPVPIGGWTISSLGGMRVFESQLWTPKGRCEATRIFVTGRWISNLSCIGTCPKTFQSIWSLYDVFFISVCFFVFFDVPCCVRRY